MTFDALSLNYTYNISIDPLDWYWILKVGPLLTFLSKKMEHFLKNLPQLNEIQFSWKVGWGENQVDLVDYDHLTNFFQILCHFQIYLEMDRKPPKKPFFTQVQGGFGPIWGSFHQPKTQKSSFFEIYPSPVGTDQSESNPIHLEMYTGNIIFNSMGDIPRYWGGFGPIWGHFHQPKNPKIVIFWDLPFTCGYRSVRIQPYSPWNVHREYNR